MKRFFKFLYYATPLIVLMACSVEQISIEQSSKLEPLTIAINGEISRTYIGEDGKSVNWCYDDVVGIYDGVSLRKFTIVEGSIEGKTAQITGMVAAEATTLRAVYPYSAAEVVDGDIVLTAPEQQQIDDHTAMDGAILSVAEFEKGSPDFTLKNIMGFLRIDITDDDLHSVIVEGNDIAGKVKVDAEGNITEVIESKSQVTLVAGAATETFAIGSYYITLLPGITQAGNFKVTYKRSNNASDIVKVVEREITIPRNGGFSTTYSPADYTIALMAGNWHLTEWAGSEPSFDVYLSIDEEGTVELWQRIESFEWEYFESTMTYKGGLLSGIYQDGVAWRASYKVTIDGDTMTWIDSLDPTDISVYGRCELPEGLPTTPAEATRTTSTERFL